MAGISTAPVVQALSKRRERLNQKVSSFLRKNLLVSAPDLQAQMGSFLLPVLESLAKKSPSRWESSLEALFDLFLELAQKGYFSGKCPAIATAWRDLLPKLPDLILQNPHSIAGGVSNSVYQLSSIGEVAPCLWIKIMGQIGPRCTNPALFFQAGKLVAWRSGMARYREEGLKIFRELDPVLAILALRLPITPQTPSRDLLYKKLMGDPWLMPERVSSQTTERRELSIVAIVGAFRGFGGQFVAPPTVFASGDKIRARDGGQEWGLEADCFGAGFYRIRGNSDGHGKGRQGTFSIDRSGMVQKGQLKAAFGILANCSSFACNSTTLAVTIRQSHSIFLIAERIAE